MTAVVSIPRAASLEEAVDRGPRWRPIADLGEGPHAYGDGRPRRFGSAVVGTSVFIFTEVMFFCGLVSAYLVLRSHTEWPPADQPRLPVMVTGINTMVLLAFRPR